MLTGRPNYGFDTEDRKVYLAWLRKTLVAYGTMVLFGITLVAVQAMTHTANVAEFAGTAVAIMGP
jgi:hypothetical protein